MFRQQVEGKHRQREQTGQDDDERHRHLKSRTDDGSHARGTQVMRGEHTLNDEEILLRHFHKVVRDYVEAGEKAKTGR